MQNKLERRCRRYRLYLLASYFRLIWSIVDSEEIYSFAVCRKGISDLRNYQLFCCGEFHLKLIVCTIYASHDLHLKTAYWSFSALVSPKVETVIMMRTMETKIQCSRKKIIVFLQAFDMADTWPAPAGFSLLLSIWRWQGNRQKMKLSWSVNLQDQLEVAAIYSDRVRVAFDCVRDDLSLGWRGRTFHLENRTRQTVEIVKQFSSDRDMWV